MKKSDDNNQQKTNKSKQRSNPLETMVSLRAEDGLQKLIDNHWNYVKTTLIIHNVKDFISIAEYHYRTAFEHGFKHGREWTGQSN